MPQTPGVFCPPDLQYLNDLSYIMSITALKDGQSEESERKHHSLGCLRGDYECGIVLKIESGMFTGAHRNSHQLYSTEDKCEA